MRVEFQMENPKGREHIGALSIDGRIILESFLG
jgi:hypothetical protein